jgi:hypothetical protein
MSTFTTPLKFRKTRIILKGLPCYEITEKFEYRVGSYDKPIVIITVPQGFITDFASIPWFFRWIFKPQGTYSKAAVIHDYLIETLKISKEMIYTRRVADTIFYEAMLVSGVNVFVAYILYRFVALYTTIKPYWDAIRGRNA